MTRIKRIYTDKNYLFVFKLFKALQNLGIIKYENYVSPYNLCHSSRFQKHSFMLYQDKTDRIIKAFYKVYNRLGYGFLEKVYQNAFLIELSRQGFEVESQYPIKVYYSEKPVGEYYADIIVDKSIVIENKAMESLREEHEYQLINYLKAIEIEVGLLFNFGKKPEFRRKIFTNSITNKEK